MIEHVRVSVRRAQFHVACTGAGPPLVLLHGWREFWWTWEPVMRLLAGRFRVTWSLSASAWAQLRNMVCLGCRQAPWRRASAQKAKPRAQSESFANSTLGILV